MKKGDLVRFTSTNNGIKEPSVGLLLEYQTWEKIATVLYCGRILRIRASDVTKAGKKDEIKKKEQTANA